MTATLSRHAETGHATTARITAFAAFLILGAVGVKALGTEPAEAPEVRLVVLIAVDQLRRDRLDDTLTGGLGRLAREGRVFLDAEIDHALTSTCPGHVALSTGRHPAAAGIAGNDYHDRASWESRYCVSDDAPDAEILGGSGEPVSARSLRVSTIGAWARATAPDARVISIAGKDRAAITLAGADVDGVYWFERSQARFTTSRYFAAALPGWVEAFNKRPLVGDAPGASLLTGLPARWQHESGSQRADDFAGEDPEYERVSGHPLAEGDGDELADRFYASPWLDTAVLGLAEAAVVEHGLGLDDSTDVLTIGLSATDSVGHRYGPRSAEAEDALKRLDADLGRFLSLLDTQVGLDHVLIAFSADHGVMELPEWRTASRRATCPVDGGRISILPLVFRGWWHAWRRHLAPFGDPRELVAFSGAGIYVNRAYALEQGLDVATVVTDIEGWLESQPGIDAAWSRTEIDQGTQPMARLFRHSFVPDRSGDLLVQAAEGCYLGGSEGTGHGSPWAYDRDVPIVLFGNQLPSARITGPAFTVDVAPSLAARAGIATPTGLDGLPRLVDNMPADGIGAAAK